MELLMQVAFRRIPVSAIARRLIGFVDQSLDALLHRIDLWFQQRDLVAQYGCCKGDGAPFFNFRFSDSWVQPVMVLRHAAWRRKPVDVVVCERQRLTALKKWRKDTAADRAEAATEKCEALPVAFCPIGRVTTTFSNKA